MASCFRRCPAAAVSVWIQPPSSQVRSFSESPSPEPYERHRRVSRTLYRQLLRWCQDVEREVDALPDNVFRYLISPVHLEAPEHLDSYRTELLNAPDDPTNTSMDAQTVRSVLQKQLFPPGGTKYQARGITLSMRSVRDVENAIRAVFRINNVERPDPLTAMTRFEELESLEKKRRDFGFEVLRNLNSLRSNQMAQLLEQHQLHRYKDDTIVQFSIGQIIQHIRDRWRGVIVTWDLIQPGKQAPTPKTKSTNPISEDFSRTSLTMKSYQIQDTVRYAVLIDLGDAYSSNAFKNRANSSYFTGGWTEVFQGDIELVTDHKLCRIRNRMISEHFDSYHASDHRFVPNPVKRYCYPAPTDAVVQPPTISAETRQLCHDQIIHGVQLLAKELIQIVTYTQEEHYQKFPYLASNALFLDLNQRLKEIETGDVLPSEYQYWSFDDNRNVDTVSPISRAVHHLTALNNLSQGIMEIMETRRQHIDFSERFRFRIGDVVRHKLYGFRGVVVSIDPQPMYDVRNWDGLQDIVNPSELPFYRVIPNQDDCVQAFGGERPMRYVCQENLETCPQDQRDFQVDMDPGWNKNPYDGNYTPPVVSQFKYGGASDIETLFEQCMEKIEERINRWHYQARDAVDSEANDYAGDTTACVISKALSLSNLLSLLQVTDKRDDATVVEDVIKEMQKGNARYELRNLMERGTQRLVASDSTHALAIFRGIVDQDPTYADVWNKIGTAEYMLGRYTDAMDATKRALELSPYHIQCLNGLGMIYFERKEYEEAAKCFEKSLELDPWNAISTKYSSCRDILHRVAFEKERNIQKKQQEEQQQEEELPKDGSTSEGKNEDKPNEKD